MSAKKILLEQADKSLPKLNYAVDLQQHAASVGFDWPDINGVIDKINEELNEVTAEISKPNNQDRLVDEMGDLLFACTNLARHLNIDPEQALQAGNQKFLRRFSLLEQIVRTNNQDFSDYSLEELDSIWDQVKSHEKNN